MQSIGIIGSGNVATQLALHIKKTKIYKLEFVHSSHVAHAAKLAKLTDTRCIKEIKDIPKVSFIIIAINDNQIKAVAKKLAKNKNIGNSDCLILHTAAAVSIEDLKVTQTPYGCLYPLQSINKNSSQDLSKIPFCIEVSDKKYLSKLKKLANSISYNIVHMNYTQRIALHVAAVMANNFTNHLFTIAQQICKQNKIKFELLNPLIQFTYNNAINQVSHKNQTGPAIRNDLSTIKKHLNFLKNQTSTKKMYQTISNDIIQNALKSKNV